MNSCIMCDNTGVYLKPNDAEKYDKLFNKYDDEGIWNMEECRRKTLEEVGYKRITPCPYCHKSPKDYSK